MATGKVIGKLLKFKPTFRGSRSELFLIFQQSFWGPVVML